MPGQLQLAALRQQQGQNQIVAPALLPAVAAGIVPGPRQDVGARPETAQQCLRALVALQAAEELHAVSRPEPLGDVGNGAFDVGRQLRPEPLALGPDPQPGLGLGAVHPAAPGGGCVGPENAPFLAVGAAGGEEGAAQVAGIVLGDVAVVLPLDRPPCALQTDGVGVFPVGEDADPAAQKDQLPQVGVVGAVVVDQAHQGPFGLFRWLQQGAGQDAAAVLFPPQISGGLIAVVPGAGPDQLPQELPGIGKLHAPVRLVEGRQGELAVQQHGPAPAADGQDPIRGAVLQALDRGAAPPGPQQRGRLPGEIFHVIEGPCGDLRPVIVAAEAVDQDAALRRDGEFGVTHDISFQEANK